MSKLLCRMNALEELLMYLGGFFAFSCCKASCGGTHRIMYEYKFEWRCISSYDDILILQKISLYSTSQPNLIASTLLPIQPSLHTTGITPAPVRCGSTLHLFLQWSTIISLSYIDYCFVLQHHDVWILFASEEGSLGSVDNRSLWESMYNPSPQLFIIYFRPGYLERAFGI